MVAFTLASGTVFCASLDYLFYVELFTLVRKLVQTGREQI